MSSILGDLNEFRVNLVKLAFRKLDGNGNGVLEISEVKEKFDASRHPDVTNGTRSLEECKAEFFDMFQTHHNVAQSFKPDKNVSIEEFLEYH
jgi:calcyphosin